MSRNNNGKKTKGKRMERINMSFLSSPFKSFQYPFCILPALSLHYISIDLWYFSNLAGSDAAVSWAFGEWQAGGKYESDGKCMKADGGWFDARAMPGRCEVHAGWCSGDALAMLWRSEHMADQWPKARENGPRKRPIAHANLMRMPSMKSLQLA